MLSKSTERIIPIVQQCLSKQPVDKAWLFGSYSRGEERVDSDIDILVRYNKEVSLFTISRIMIQLEKAIGRKVDLIEEDCLMPFAAASANRDKLLIYERANQR
ncbi:MAG: nucleotidyltransferase domain-containing protein [Bacteroidaceae bacterium]|nr:nucleotidyltransferase domain-containing protein [Bacteroidaceae bacterium]